jgi:hypothetical protein
MEVEIHILYREIISELLPNSLAKEVEETGYLHQCGPHTLRQAAQSTSLQANKPQTKLTQIAAKSRYTPCYSCIPGIAIKSSHSGTEVPFRKQQTWNFKPDFLCHVS